MSNTRYLDALSQALSDAGVPVSGAKLYFYESGTSTPKDTYSDSGLTTPNQNPVEADSAGRFGDIFLAAGNYKVALTTAADVPIRTLDPVAANVTTVSAFMETLLDDTSASAALTTLGVSSFMQGVLDDTSAAAAQSTLGLSGTAAWLNPLINSDFRVHQRGTASVTSSGDFVCDRWLVAAVSGSRTVTRVVLDAASRTSIGRESAAWCLEYAATGGTGASDYEKLIQRIEDVRTLGGKTVTISFWAKYTSGSGNLSIELLQRMGTGGSPSPDVSTTGTIVTLTGSWARYTVTIAIPSIVGKTLGSNGDHSLDLVIWVSAGTAYDIQTGGLPPQTITVQIADIMMQEGTSAPAFVARPMQTEMALCMRYFETSNPTGTYATHSEGDGRGVIVSHPTAGCLVTVPFSVPKRAAATVTTYDRAGTAARYSYNTGSWSDGGSWSSGPTSGLGGFNVTHTTASSNITSFTWQASAEL